RPDPAAYPGAGPVDQYGDRRGAWSGTGLRAGGARHNAAPPTAAGRGAAIRILRLAAVSDLGTDGDGRAGPVSLGTGVRGPPVYRPLHGGQCAGRVGDVLSDQQPLYRQLIVQSRRVTG